MSELKSLTIERGSIKSALTRLQRFFRENVDNTTTGSLQKRLTANMALYDRFNTVQTKIEMLVLDTEAEQMHAVEREKFETTYFDLVDEIETHIEKSKGPCRETCNTPVCSATSGTASIKLPTIVLPTFDGNHSNWLKFHDSFISLVHNNEVLSDVQRFHYLNSSLKGPAARMIQSLGVSDANYKLAWEMLNSRYESSTTLKRHHVTCILDLNCIQKNSEVALREFLDDVMNHRMALKALGEPVDGWDTLIIPLLSRKLDSISLREWERRISSYTEMATFTQFASFLEERAKYLANVSANSQVTTPRVDQRPRNSGSWKPSTVTSHIVTSRSCPACQGNHCLYQCNKFKGEDINQRTKIVQEAQLCFNCLGSGHRVRACTRSTCKHCNRRHHSLLHRSDLHPDKISTNSVSNESVNSIEPQPCVSNVANNMNDCMVLATAIVNVRDKRGNIHRCRALLDSGSQANFITIDLCKRLGIQPLAADTTVTGLGNAINSIQGRTQIQINSIVNNFKTSVNCLAIETITSNMPNFFFKREHVDVPQHMKLADPEFNVTRPIDMLIGSGLFWTLLCVGQQRTRSGLTWQKTQLGWVLGGALTRSIKQEPIVSRCHVAANNEIESQLEKFCKLEKVNSECTLETDECEARFKETTRRDDSGRCIVGIPFKPNVGQLGASQDQAIRRLHSLERKLNKHPDTAIKTENPPEEKLINTALTVSAPQEYPICNRFSNFSKLELLVQRQVHFGGLREAAVRSAKHHLKSVVGDQRLTYEEQYTILTQVESCLNSRPIPPLPPDLSPLTPGHLLIGAALSSLPERDLKQIKVNRLSRFQLMQQIPQHFWQRWQRECIHQMQQRHKWHQHGPETIAKDTLVLIKEDNTPPLQWNLGRIVKLHPGQDGVSRVATLRTANGLFKRPLTKLCVLPLNDDTEHISRDSVR